MHKYLFSIIIGIILFLCYNNINKFSIGIPVRYYLYMIYNDGSFGDIYVSQRGNIDSWEYWDDADDRRYDMNRILRRNKTDYRMNVGAFIYDDPSETPTRAIQLIPSDDDEYTEPEQQPFPNDQIPDDTDNYDTDDDEIIDITQPIIRPEPQTLEPAPMPETEPTTEIPERPAIISTRCSAFTRIS